MTFPYMYIFLFCSHLPLPMTLLTLSPSHRSFSSPHWPLSNLTDAYNYLFSDLVSFTRVAYNNVKHIFLK